MNWILFVAASLTLGTVAIAVYVRVAPVDPADVHVDPLVSGAQGPKSAFVAPPDAPVFAQSPERVFAALTEIIKGAPRVAVIEVDGPGLHASFVVRSRYWRFPDFVSVRVLPHEDGASLAIYARARFGGYDHGVNQARIDRWLAALPGRLGAS